MYLNKLVYIRESRVINLNDVLAHKIKFLKCVEKSNFINIILLFLIKLRSTLITRVLIIKIFDLNFYLYIFFDLIMFKYF